MNKNIEWKQSTNFLGRNGYFKCNGIEVFKDTKSILIQPITSKGNTGRCFIEIPANSIPALSKCLHTRDTGIPAKKINKLLDACKYVIQWHREHDSGEGELFGLDFVTTCINAVRDAEGQEAVTEVMRKANYNREHTIID